MKTISQAEWNPSPFCRATVLFRMACHILKLPGKGLLLVAIPLKASRKPKKTFIHTKKGLNFTDVKEYKQ